MIKKILTLIFCLFTMPVFAAVSYNADANCIGSWAMTSGSTETDLCGGGTTLTESASDDIPTSADTPNIHHKTTSRDFEKGDTEALDAADGGETDINGANQAMSIVAWVKPETIDSNHVIVTKYLTTGNQRQYEFRFDSAGALICSLSGDGTNITQAQTANGVVTTGVWYHVACVSNDTDIRIYLDGVLSSNGASNPITYTAGLFDGTAAFYVGGRTAASSLLDGKLYDVGLFNDALTADEVFEIYSHGMSGTAKRRIIQ